MSDSLFRSSVRRSRQGAGPILAFNVVDLASLSGVLDASVEMAAPVIAQWSARTVSFYGAGVVSAASRAAIDESGASAFVHLDHCDDDRVLAAALEAGFDGIMADGSHLPFDENISWTRQWVEKARATGAVVEGELGAIRGHEDGFAGGRGGAEITLDDYLAFAESTGVDLLGADIGTAHGVYVTPPALRMELLEDLVDRNDAPGFVVHGCSGLSAETIHGLVRLRAVKLNYSTDLKHSWATGVLRGLHDKPEPLDALRQARLDVTAMATARWTPAGRRS